MDSKKTKKSACSRVDAFKDFNTVWKNWAAKEYNVLSVQILYGSDPCHFDFHELCQLDTLAPFGM